MVWTPPASLVRRAVEDKKKDEEEEREQEEVKRLEEVVFTRMQRLEAEVMKYAGRDRSRLSDLENAAVTLVVHSNALKKRRREEEEEEEEEQEKAPEGSFSSLWTSLCPSATSSSSRKCAQIQFIYDLWTFLLCSLVILTPDVCLSPQVPATIGPNPPCDVHVLFTAAELRQFASEHTHH